MNNGKQISFSLCGAIALVLSASVNAEEVATHSLDVSDKILLMETINVTSNKEVADEDLIPDDPEVDRVLKLVDSLALLTEDTTEQSANEDTDETIDEDTDNLKSNEANINTKKTVETKGKLSDSDSKQTKSLKKDSENVSDQKPNKSN